MKIKQILNLMTSNEKRILWIYPVYGNWADKWDKCTGKTMNCNGRLMLYGEVVDDGDLHLEW